MQMLVLPRQQVAPSIYALLKLYEGSINALLMKALLTLY